MPPYSYITLAAAQQQLANRLYDSGQVFWPTAELTSYIVEALRTWNALTSFYRNDFTFAPTQGTTFYDLTSTASMPQTLRSLTLRDIDLYPSLQSRLLEPTTWNPWAGASTQFSADDLFHAVERRRNEVLAVTGCQITRRTVPAVAGRISLPDSVIDIRRVAYLPGALVGGSPYGLGIYGIGAYSFAPYVNPSAASVVWPEDAWAEQSFNRSYPQQPAGTPFHYLASTEPPISFDVDRAPGLGGSYEVLTVESGSPLSIATPALLGVPDDWSWVVAWGALADLLSRDSLAADPARAAYCESRYRMGLAALDAAPSVLAARVNNVPLQIDAVRSADLFSTSWEGTQGPPRALLTAGLNLVAPMPTPDTGAHSYTLTVVQNMPVPVAPTDALQISRGDLDAIIDYAEHLAMFKCGGAEFASTAPLLQRFLKQCAGQNSKLLEIAEFTSLLYGMGREEARMNPRYAEVVPATEATE